MSPRRLSGAIAVVGLLFTLTACGGDDDSSAADGSGTTASAVPSEGGGPGQGGPGGGDPSQFAQIQECLEAAGLGDELPSGGPSGAPSDLPTNGVPPSGFPTDGTPPSGFPSGGPGGGAGGLLQDPDVQAALEACGIDVPTGAPSGAPSQAAS